MHSESVSKDFCALSADLLDQSMVKIRHCLAQLDEEQTWWRPAEELNSIGNLCLHVCGNLRQWGIVPLTEQEDTRKRDAEFAADVRVLKKDLLRTIESVVNESKEVWAGVTETELLERTMIQGFAVNIMQAISHTSAHFVGHTHQVIFLTRLQLGSEYQFQWSEDTDRDRVPI